MKIIADLHLHSKYSRAVSPQMVIPEIARWGRKKGIDLLGAPDWTHPLFFRELKQDLVEVGEGVFQVKNEKFKIKNDNSKFKNNGVYFILATEISSIYSQGGRGRRIHTLFFAPSFSVAEKINQKLLSYGVKLMSDGRPVTGLSVRQLAEIAFSISKDCLVVPSHLWTPWFGTYGDKGGFDSLKEAYGDLVDNIYAIETGHSSSPAMNWRIEELDSRSILSFSDAHSLPKMSREATVFQIKNEKLKVKNRNSKFKIAYNDIAQAIKQDSQSDWEIGYTIEFYPQEGKYHYTGHRKCGVKHSPEETKKLGKTCPVCGRELTVGVMHRVEELATRKVEEVKTKEVIIGGGLKGIGWQNRPPYVMLVPLIEILSESLSAGISSQIVETEYNRLVTHFGSEFKVLLDVEIPKVAAVSGEKIAEAISRVRTGQVSIDPGYDGVFGRVGIWPSSAKDSEDEEEKQMSLF